MASISGAFRGAPLFSAGVPTGHLLNLQDLPNVAGAAQRTAGGTAIDLLPLQPALMYPWQILAWTIGFDLWVFQDAFVPMYGRLGNIFGGLSGMQQTVGLVGVTPVLPFPPEASLMTEVWDGDQSPAPPIGNPSPLGAPSRITTTFPLPQPILLEPGQQLSIGLWITPSVAANGRLVIANATWTIAYETTSQRSIT